MRTTPISPFFDEVGSDEVHPGAAFADGTRAGGECQDGGRSEPQGAFDEICEPAPARGEGGAQPAGEEADGGGVEPGAGGSTRDALDTAVDEELARLRTEAGADGKPQTVIPGAEHASDKTMAQRSADAPLKPKAAQKDVGGLFDGSMETDLMDFPGAEPSASFFEQFANNKIFTADKVKAARARLHSKFVVVRPVKQTEESLFLSKVEAKFRTLLEESPDPQWEIQDAARRMEAEDMLWQRPWPNSNPRQAAFKMFGDNKALTEWWMDIRDRGWWASALTPEELITAILPKYDTLD